MPAAKTKSKTKARLRGPTEVDVAVGGKIRMRRTMMKLSQSELGDAIGVSFQQIQKYEKGTNRVGASRLSQIAKKLDTDPSWFFEGEGSGKRSEGRINEVSESFASFMMDKYAARLVRTFSGLEENVKRAIVSLAEQVSAA